MSFMERKYKICIELNAIPIPEFENYLLTRNAKLYFINPTDESITDVSHVIFDYSKNGIPIYRLLSNKSTLEIKLDKLMLNTFNGDLQAPIIHRDSDKSNCKLDNLKYDLRDISYLESGDIVISNTIFKKIPDTNNNLYISENGIMYSRNKNKILRITIDNKFYYRTSHGVGSSNTMRIHKIVYITWVGDIINGYTINHIDGIKYHNHYSNLEAITNAQNFRHAQLNDLRPNSRWSEVDIHKMCQMMEDNKSSVDIAKVFGLVSLKDRQIISRTLSDIRHNVIWKDISIQYKIENYDIKKYGSHGNLTKENVIEICELLMKKIPQVEIAKRFNISVDHINAIKRKQRWFDVTSKYEFVPYYNTSLNKETVAKICQMIDDGKPAKEIRNTFNISKSSFDAIRGCKQWKSVSCNYNFFKQKIVC